MHGYSSIINCHVHESGIAMMAKTIDAAETNGDALIKMMEASVTPNLGQNIDVRL